MHNPLKCPDFHARGNAGSSSISPSCDCINISALPLAWKSGHFKGLCTENGAVVDCYWNDCVLKKIIIKSKIGGTYKILMPDGNIKEIKLKKNEKKIILNS